MLLRIDLLKICREELHEDTADPDFMTCIVEKKIKFQLTDVRVCFKISSFGVSIDK